MKRNNEIWLRILVLGTLLMAGEALAQDTELTFHWAPSPIEAEGEALAPAIKYEVRIVLDGVDEPVFESVRDTVFVLSVEPGVVHRICVRGVDALNRVSEWSEFSDPVYIELDEERGEIPMAGVLGAIYPNPFNPETRIEYGIPGDLPQGAPIRLEIFNLAGRRIRSMETETTPGLHEVIWNGTDDQGQPAPSGMYVTRYICGTIVETKKMTMLK